MIYRVLYDGIDIHTNSVPDVLINPTVETEMNTAGSFTFTLPPDHFAWGDIYVFKGNVEVYENNDLIFFGRVANVDQNWNNERVVECEGALAFFNDSIQRPNSWTSNTLISQFLSDILDNHNAQVPDNRKIYLGNVTIDDMYVTRETNYEKTLDVLTRMCIDTNGGYFSLRKDENDGKIYLDWLKDLTDIAAQPVEFGLNLLDISRSLHAEDIVTGVLARGGEVNDVKIDLHEVGEIDDPSIPVIHHTNQDPDILWHRDGLEGYGRVVQVKEFNDCTTVDGDNGLLAKATEWLVKQNTDIDTIEVDAAELGYFGESYPIFLLGQKVVVNSHPHHLENVELPMYKISMNLDSGTKRISIGTPPKRELTQISASNMGGGSGSGSSSGGGSGSGGVQDVRVNGTSVVQDGIARVNVPTDTVTESEMNTAISTAVSGKANQSDLESLATTVAGKANTSDVNTALAQKADKTEIPEIEANPSDAATDTLNKIDIDGTVYQLAGGTEVEANPVEAATDDLETIKIGNTVYDITGSGGGSTNYGKFTYDLLLKNDPLPTYQNASNGVNRSYTLSKSIDDYDAVYVIACTDYNSRQTLEGCTDRLILKNNYYDSSHVLSGSYSDGRLMYVTFTDDTTVNTAAWGNSGYCPVLYKVYGVKFENKLINRSDIYSEEERMIGRWTDGKPLYQKTITISSVSYNSSWHEVDHNISDIDTIGSVEGVVIDNNGDAYYPANTYRPTYTIGILIGATKTKIEYINNWLDSASKLIVTLRYTKTTDSADSGVIPEDPMFISDPMIFSEEEQVVGSWTDGKPLYQRTIVKDLTLSASWQNYYDLTGIDLVNVEIDELIRDGEPIPLAFSNIGVGSWIKRDGYLKFCVQGSQAGEGWVLKTVTIRYTKTTDSVLSGPKKGKIVQRSDIYSEEERMIGRWTDGKPLYQKTWFNVSNGTDLVSNVDTLVDYRVKKRGTSGSEDYQDIGDGFRLEDSSVIKITNNIAAFYCWTSNQGYLNKTAEVITLKYTKTTDAPFSKQLIEDPQFVMMSDIHSEDELVVGRWTDGKPIYQKTMSYDFTSSTNDWTLFDDSVSYENLVAAIPSMKALNSSEDQIMLYGDADTSPRWCIKNDHKLYYYLNNARRKGILTIQYTKTTDAPGTGPTKGNLIYLPALYSEEEREVGVWTDGKPLYQKTINFGTLPNNTTKTVSSGLTNVVMHNIFGVAKAPNGFTLTLPHREISGTGNIDIVYQADNYVRLVTDYNYSSYTSYITLQYTKTTDQPGSGKYLPDGQLAHHYSTSEKVVGTWIDGSTVYERTWDFSSNPISLPYDTWINTTIQSSDGVYRIVSAECLTSGFLVIDGNEVCVSAGGYPVGICAKINHGRSLGYLTLRYTKSS